MHSGWDARCCGGTRRIGGGLIDGDPELGGQCGQPSVVALADGVEFPVRPTAVEGRDLHHGLAGERTGHEGEVLRLRCHRRAELAALAERCTLSFGAAHDDDAVDVSRHGAEVDVDLVVGHQTHARRLRIVEKDEIVIGTDPAVGTQQHRRYVDRRPAAADADPIGAICQRCLGPFDQWGAHTSDRTARRTSARRGMAPLS